MSAPLVRVATLLDHADELARAAGMNATVSASDAEALAKRASEKAREALQILGELGHRPERAPAPLRVARNPLAELAAVERSRPEALALLDALKTARARAEALDEAHGGSDWEDDLGELIARVELSIFGPSDRVTGRRE